MRNELTVSPEQNILFLRHIVFFIGEKAAELRLPGNQEGKVRHLELAMRHGEVLRIRLIH
jgi:hypothetical protein